MEPLSIVTISAAVGGVAGKVVEKAWDAGEKWLSSYFKDHHKQAQEKAKTNALDFLNDLAKRIHVVEESSKTDSAKIKAIDQALEDPDFSAILRDAIISSSRTDNAEKHRILSRIVSERLVSKPEDLVSMTSSMACDAVSHLGNRHLYILAIVTVVYYLRPHPLPPPIPKEQLGPWYIAWLEKMFRPLVDKVECTNMDFLHLLSVACVKYDPILSRDIKRILRPGNIEEITEDLIKEFIDKKEVGVKLNKLWSQGLQHIALTSIGQLIGVYVTDELLGTKTLIDW